MRCQTAIPPLPKLRPTVHQNAMAETPRGEFSRSIFDEKNFGTDFEVNRTLFANDNKTETETITIPTIKAKPKTVKVKVDSKTPRKLNSTKFVDPMDPDKNHPKEINSRVKSGNSQGKSIKKGKKSSLSSSKTFETQPENTRVPQKNVSLKNDEQNVNEEVMTNENLQESQENLDDLEFLPELQQVQDLTKRIPDVAIITQDNVFEFTPILDRILCTVSEWSKDVITNFSDHYVIKNLQQKLFTLIDVDDFLLRTIICRILLTFAIDSSSPLLLPICKIFFKLSIDETNDYYFVDEKLSPILLSLIQISSPEAKVYAASALKNITKNEGIRQDLYSQVDINNFNIFTVLSPFLGIKTKGKSQQTSILKEHEIPLKIQLLGVIRHMCEDERFSGLICQKQFLTEILKNINESDISSKNGPIIIQDILRIVPQLCAMQKEEKLYILKKIISFNISEKEFQSFLISILHYLCKDIEDQEECSKFILVLIKKVLDDPNNIIALLKIAIKCADSEPGKKVLSSTPNIILQILESEYEATVSSFAYKIIKKIDQPQFKPILTKYSMYDF